jgi:hypothetical protein
VGTDTNANANAKAAMPDVQTATNHLLDQVDGRVFWETLAARGIRPQTQKQAADLWEMGLKLQAAAEHPRLKAAAEAADPIAEASGALDRLLGPLGMQSKAAEEADLALYRFSAGLAGDPTTYNAVLAMEAHRAAALAQAS